MKINRLSFFPALALILSACLPSLSGASDQTVSLPAPSLSINGSGSVTLEPDIVTISIGVNTQDNDPSSAVARNSRQVESIAVALSELGIGLDDTQTSNFSIWPRQDYDFEGNPISTTFVVDNTLTVIVRNLDSLGAVLDTAINAGANNIYGITFDISDREDAISQATQLAVQNAEERAQNLAGAANVQLGEVLMVSSFVGGGGFVDPFARGLGGGGGSDVATVPISSGQLMVSVDVNVTYAMAPSE